MKKQSLLIIAILAVFVIGGLFLLTKNKGENSPLISNQQDKTSPSGKNTVTAKKAYGVALPEAKKFSSDSYLVNLTASSAEKDGKFRTWYILFYSPSKNTNFKVNVIEGKITGTSDTNKKKQNQVNDDWIDTD